MMKDGMKSPLHIAAWWLIVIGGLNWGLIGVFKFNLVNALLGSVPWLETLVYILVGLSAVVALVGMATMNKK